MNYSMGNRLDPVRLGRTGLTVSRVGFGGYRIDQGEPEQAAALRSALLSGCNLVDTSTNYNDGRSELLIGETVRALIGWNVFSRDELVIVSKIGYVQGSNLSEARERARQGRPYPEMVEYTSGCWHNISPEFLEEQLTRSLERLALEQLDVLLLHNPEYFLKTSGDHDEYYRRIAKAFAHLEREVSAAGFAGTGFHPTPFPIPRTRPSTLRLKPCTASPSRSAATITSP